jgi:hypothetical protein
VSAEKKVFHNYFGVGVNGAGEVNIMRRVGGPMTKEYALNLAAWLVLCADDDTELFGDILKHARDD